jgi:AcrR family transcriptional regulator
MPKVVDHDAYRSKLIRDSFQVVAKVGYGSLSMKQLASGIGVSTGSIYNYFKGKEDWFVSLVTHYSGEVFEMLTREVPADAPLPKKAALLVEHIDRHKELYANMISVASDFVRMPSSEKQEGALELTFAADQLYAYFAALFDTDQATGRALLAHIIGVVMTNRLDPRGIDVNAQLPYMRLLLEAAAPVAEKESQT